MQGKLEHGQLVPNRSLASGKVGPVKGTLNIRQTVGGKFQAEKTVSYQAPEVIC